MNIAQPFALLFWVVVAAIIWMVIYYVSAKPPIPSEIRWLLLLLVAIVEIAWILRAFGVV